MAPVIIIVFILAAICILFVILAFCTCLGERYVNCINERNAERQRLQQQQRQEQQRQRDDIFYELSSQVQSVGLPSAVIYSLPSVQFRKEIKEATDKAGDPDCSVCLGEFKHGEWLRYLPNCAHVFHAPCIDTWFRSHSTCPLCRKDVLYDFSGPGFDGSPMEDTCREQPLGRRLWESVMMGAISNLHVIETDSDESAFDVSPIIGPPHGMLQLLKYGCNYNGESSNGDRNVQNLSSPEVPH